MSEEFAGKLKPGTSVALRDAEGVMLAVRRNSTTFGQLQAAVTVAHTNFFSYVPAGSSWTSARGWERWNPVDSRRRIPVASGTVTAWTEVTSVVDGAVTFTDFTRLRASLANG